MTDYLKDAPPGYVEGIRRSMRTHTPPRPSTAPHAKVERDVADLIVRTDNQRRNLDQLDERVEMARVAIAELDDVNLSQGSDIRALFEFRREVTEALQGIRAELDRLADTDQHLAQGLLALAQEPRISWLTRLKMRLGLPVFK